jgi:hypothetical protein
VPVSKWELVSEERIPAEQAMMLMLEVIEVLEHDDIIDEVLIDEILVELEGTHLHMLCHNDHLSTYCSKRERILPP